MMTHHPLLSKSDFKVARECPAKLYYRKHKYPNTLQDDPYLALLAEGGYAVGHMAQLQHEGGIDLGDIADPAEAVARTNALLNVHENVTLFEPGVRHGDLFARIDILVKRGRTLDLIEVKSIGWDSKTPDLKPHTAPNARMRPYIEDLAFQTHVLSSAFPGSTVKPFLLMPDKAKQATLDGLNHQFEISADPLAPGTTPGFRKIRVRFTGNLEAVRREDLLTKVDMQPWVATILADVRQSSARFAASLSPALTKLPTTLGMKCAKCEYRTEGDGLNGFNECWEPLALPKAAPMVLDLYKGGSLNRDGRLDKLIMAGKVLLKDVPDEYLQNVFGKPAFNGRPMMQKNRATEWVDVDLRIELHNWVYPLHFIDFETSRMALPYHSGMQPWEQIAFQWSCHTIATRGAEPVHTDWINTEDDFPSFAFARSLKERIGDTGTVLIWSQHETTALREIRQQLRQRGVHDPDLADWLDRMAPPKDSGLRSPLEDMNALAVRGYFHPATKARTSIKVTLPSVLWPMFSDRPRRWLQDHGWGMDLWRIEEGRPVNPYDLLPAVKGVDAYEVHEGTGAMRAYQDMLYGLASRDAERRQSLREALRAYCKLDTLAMVIIWEYWQGAWSGTKDLPNG
jgi:hypothetical protein